MAPQEGLLHGDHDHNLSHCYENRYILFHSRTIHTDAYETPGISRLFLP